MALSAEQRINDGMIDIDGLTMDEKVLVYADPDLIHQVAYNLLDNAIKFTPAGGTIRFGVERLGPEVEVSIWNSGQGISPEALPYVFQRFYKEDQSRGLHARGAGLGLNICKVLVNLSGGQIRVESKQGEWVQVRLHPARPAPQPRRHEASARRERPPRCGGRPGQHEAGRLNFTAVRLPLKRSGLAAFCVVKEGRYAELYVFSVKNTAAGLIFSLFSCKL